MEDLRNIELVVMREDKMKICYLADAKAMHIKRWAEYFSDRGYKVHLITLNPKTVGHFNNIKLHTIRKIGVLSTPISRFLNLLPVLNRIKRLIKYVNPDILHAHSAGGYAWLGMLTGFHPLIVTPWGSDVLIDIFD